jgi:hypothetical protein
MIRPVGQLSVIAMSVELVVQGNEFERMQDTRAIMQISTGKF